MIIMAITIAPYKMLDLIQSSLKHTITNVNNDARAAATAFKCLKNTLIITRVNQSSTLLTAV